MTLVLAACASAPTNGAGPEPGRTVAVAREMTTATSASVPPGSRTLYGFPDNNYPGGPVAVVSCETTVTFGASDSSLTVTKIGLVNKRPDRITNVDVTYSLTSFDATDETDEALSGGMSVDLAEIGPFEYREVVDRRREVVADRHAVLDGMVCGIADIDDTSGKNVQYPHATEHGRDVTL